MESSIIFYRHRHVVHCLSCIFAMTLGCFSCQPSKSWASFSPPFQATSCVGNLQVLSVVEENQAPNLLANLDIWKLWGTHISTILVSWCNIFVHQQQHTYVLIFHHQAAWAKPVQVDSWIHNLSTIHSPEKNPQENPARKTGVITLKLKPCNFWRSKSPQKIRYICSGTDPSFRKGKFIEQRNNPPGSN